MEEGSCDKEAKDNGWRTGDGGCCRKEAVCRDIAARIASGRGEEGGTMREFSDAYMLIESGWRLLRADGGGIFFFSGTRVSLGRVARRGTDGSRSTEERRAL